MGKQITYWLGYKDFLEIAQVALDCGCIIIKATSDKMVYGHSLDVITEYENRYFFYIPEAGELLGQSLPLDSKRIDGYTASANTVIQAGFSLKNDEKKEITRSRLFAISGYYNEKGEYVERPDCVTKIYNKLVRVVKKVAPYTELTDTYISTNNDDYSQEKEWKHKEYITPQFFQLKTLQNYRLR